jgi:uncharacterized protein
MNLEQGQKQQSSIINYSQNSVILENKELNFPCFISENYILENISLENIKNLIDKSQISVLIIGTNNQIPIKEQAQIRKIIPCEFMGIKSAVYSFNIMLDDYRNPGVIFI